MPRLPRPPGDLAYRLHREGYRAFDQDRTARGVADGAPYETRLLGRRAHVLTGAEGARAFYDEHLVEREGAVPPPLARLLFGRGAVHGLDDEPHRRRKDVFLGLLGPAQVADCAERAAALLAERLRQRPGTELGVHDTLVTVYGTAVLDWVGLELEDASAADLSRRYAAIVDGFGFAGSAYARAWHHRLGTDRWARTVIRDVRAGRAGARSGSPAAALAASDLDVPTAAVELGNLVRPTVAVSWLGAFATIALDGLSATPGWRELLATPGAGGPRWAFTQEVRRLAPFVPALAGRVRRDDPRHSVRRGDLVVLDVRGIDLDDRRWPEPWRFDPRRFLTVDGAPRVPDEYELVPQGGGPATGHRCPGESMTLQLLGTTTEALAAARWTLLSAPTVDLARIPTLPRDGVRLRIEDA